MTGQRETPVLAADIGGTKILTALITPDGRMLARDVVPTLAAEGVKAVIERLAESIDRVLHQETEPLSPPSGIGIACAGGIDTARGIVATPSPNLPDWADIPLRDNVQERFGLPALLINDASAAALGEHRFGAGRGVRHLVMLTLGTGIGGGIIIDGRLYLGARGAAAEIGHMTVAADGPRCNCGNTGCLEMMASGTAVEREAIRRLRLGEESVLAEITGGEDDMLTAEKVGLAAEKGDRLAREVLGQAAYYLGIGLVSLVNIFNPEMIVLGGGMVAIGDVLTGPARAMVAERAFRISAGAVRIVTAELGNDAGVYGAAAYARDSLSGGEG